MPALGWIVAACLAHACPSTPVGPVDASLAPAPLVDLRPLEVRIRKLYLVRPDLLQFPNPYDVVC